MGSEDGRMTGVEERSGRMRKMDTQKDRPTSRKCACVSEIERERKKGVKRRESNWPTRPIYLSKRISICARKIFLLHLFS